MHHIAALRSVAVLGIAALLAGGCASGQGSMARTQRASTVDETTGKVTDTYSTTDVYTDSVAAAPDAAMRAVIAGYTALGLTPNEVMPAQRHVGAVNVLISRQLQGVPLTQYFNCGNDLGTPIAATGRLQVTVTTDVRPSGSGSELLTSASALATRVNTGAKEDPRSCTSTGNLEAKVRSEILSHLQ